MGRVARGSPLISRMMRNFRGTSVYTGRTFLATGLYFFVAKVDKLFGGGDAKDVEEFEYAKDGEIETGNAKQE
jgi:hypothetical protein